MKTKSKQLAFVFVLLVTAFLAYFLVSYMDITKIGKATNESENEAKFSKAVMYKSPFCGCCVEYAEYLNKNGIEVEIVSDASKMLEMKQRFSIPVNIQSCHTIVFSSKNGKEYFVEGHVPIEVVNKFLNGNYEFLGISLPAMPSGSPGMPGIKKETWKIYAVKEDGSYTIFDVV